MNRLVLLAVLLLAPLAQAAPRYVSLVLYPGQELSYTAAAPLLTVNAGAQAKRPVNFTFDQYGTRMQLSAKLAGTVTLLCEYADNHIGEIISVTVVPRKLYDLHQRTLNALRGVEGLSGDDIMVAGDVVVTGKLYAQGDLERCLALERETAKQTPRIVCGARLSSASAIVTPALGYAARANLEAQSDVATFGANGSNVLTWNVTVRVGDVPVLRVVSADRTRLLTTAGRLTNKLNTIIDAWRAQTEQKGMAYPVTFRSKVRPDGYELTALWSFGHGTTGDALATISLDDLAPVAAEANVTPDRLVQWWLALMEDAFRLYFMAERPVRTGATASTSPVLSLYQSALKLRHAELDPHSAPTAVARAYFALRLASGRDPFETLLTTPPADFARSTP